MEALKALLNNGFTIKLMHIPITTVNYKETLNNTASSCWWLE